jgi:hypothetical protein
LSYDLYFTSPKITRNHFYNYFRERDLYKVRGSKLKKRFRKSFYILFCLILFIANSCTQIGYQKGDLHRKISSIDMINFNSFVLKDENTVALWLGEKIKGKNLVQPINLVIIDKVSVSEEESIKKLETLCHNTGYKKRGGHSSGYIGILNKKIYTQLPKEFRVSYSDDDFWKPNNHIRFFGPYKNDNNEFVFIGEASRERFELFAFIHHKYVSFNQARNDFTNKATGFSSNISNKCVLLDNTMNTEFYSSGDHDGYAYIIYLN